MKKRSREQQIEFDFASRPAAEQAPAREPAEPLGEFARALNQFQQEMDRADSRGPVYPGEVAGAAQALLAALGTEHPRYRELSQAVDRGNEARINELAYQILRQASGQAA